MLNNVNPLAGSTATATDGEMGPVTDAGFDDRAEADCYAAPIGRDHDNPLHAACDRQGDWD